MGVLTIGVLAARGDERRVALVPDTVRRLTRAGTQVVVEAGAGAGAHYPDRLYEDAGAKVAKRRDVLEKVDALVSVDRPADEDLSRMRAGQALLGLFGPARDSGLVNSAAAKGLTLVSLDSLPRTLSRAQSMDVLTSQANVAGYKSVIVAAGAFGRYFPMLITAAGTSRPAKVLVVGAGVAGLAAMGTARRLGAVVTGYDVRPETRTEIESVGARFLALKEVGGGGAGGYARALTPEEQQAQQAELQEHIAGFDVVITTALVPGRRPPLIVTSQALGQMRPGSVIVDMASGPDGGNVEGSVAGTTVITESGASVIGASDLAVSVPTAASDAFSQNMAAVIGLIYKEGVLSVDLGDEVQAATVVTHKGQVVNATIKALMEEEDGDERIAAV